MLGLGNMLPTLRCSNLPFLIITLMHLVVAFQSADTLMVYPQHRARTNHLFFEYAVRIRLGREKIYGLTSA